MVHWEATQCNVRDHEVAGVCIYHGTPCTFKSLHVKIFARQWPLLALKKCCDMLKCFIFNRLQISVAKRKMKEKKLLIFKTV